MGAIPHELVEKTWREVASFSPARARKDMERAGRRQPNLLGFVLGMTQDLEPDAHGLAVYLYFVILRIFEKATPRNIREVKAETIEARLDHNEELVLRLENAHPRFFERTAMAEASGQPFVVQYLVEAIMEAPEDDVDPVELSEEESGTIFLVLKTVIDVLDEAQASGGSAE